MGLTTAKWEKCVVVSGGRGCLMCPMSHLGALSNITASGSTGDGAAPRCNANDVKLGMGQRCPLPRSC